MFRCPSLSSATPAFGLMSAVNVQPAGKVIKPIRNRDAWPRGRSLASGPSKWDFLHPGGNALSDKKKSVRSANATPGFQDAANLDDADIWPTCFSLKTLTTAVHEKMSKHAKRATR